MVDRLNGTKRADVISQLAQLTEYVVSLRAEIDTLRTRAQASGLSYGEGLVLTQMAERLAGTLEAERGAILEAVREFVGPLVGEQVEAARTILASLEGAVASLEKFVSRELPTPVLEVTEKAIAPFKDAMDTLRAVLAEDNEADSAIATAITALASAVANQSAAIRTQNTLLGELIAQLRKPRKRTSVIEYEDTPDGPRVKRVKETTEEP